MKSKTEMRHGPNGTYLEVTRFSFENGDSDASCTIHFGNNGSEIVETNYFDSQMGKAGMFYLGMNAGVARLLIPDCAIQWVKEMQTGDHCVLTSGIYQGQPSMEIMFDDGSKSPFALFLPLSNCDFQPRTSDVPFVISAWTRAGKVGQWEAFSRMALRLPCLQPVT
jgi:hypothetical protein